ncbi:MAG: HsdR family type I site-specific deoxyribonuclease [Chloroflexota bacterium]|nr:HsdR family type I site-specific deoxyribonuclease [Chloroflexota bacterium]
MSERSAVQNPMLRYAEAVGWEYVPPAQALTWRAGDRGLLFTGILSTQLQALNPGVVDAAATAEILRRLGLLRPTMEGNRDLLGWLRGEQSLFVPAENRERQVRLVDFGDPTQNVYHVTDEWRYQGVAHANRADVVFLINGIPVAVAETKRAGKKDGLEEGIAQIRRYHQETPEMLLLPQLFGVTELFNLFYGATWSTARKALFNWKDEGPSGDYERKIRSFFDRGRLLRVLHDYIIFLTRDDELSKVILRQHQTRAVEKVLARVQDAERRRGLIWHTQGSGKTLTMITIAARLLRESGDRDKPTVLMLVDRNELEQQLFRNIQGYGIPTVEVAQSKADLERILKSDYRGLVVSMIHKFDGLRADLNLRSDVVVLVDEAHRTTGGDLGTYLLAALPNATYIGFTGTPIDRLTAGRSTFHVFNNGADREGYLDKYSIAESIDDGTTVALNYALAPSDLRVDQELLNRAFLSLSEAEGVADVEELNAILDRAVELRELMKAPTRVAQIAAYVAQHFQENVEPLGFKAFLVAVDREACALYKAELDKHLPADYSAVVYSGAHNDPPLLKAHQLSEEREKEIRKAFAKKGTRPKILIVTEKLLTGFDAPILYCMYLDKPMRDHVLLQAIARVNRPYEDEDGQVKPYGFVLDFVGIFERLESALAFDSDVVASVIQNIDVLKGTFETQMRDDAPAYLPLTRGWDDKAKERAVDYFADKPTREAFYQFFRRLESLYEILSPDAALRPYLDDYQALAELFAAVRYAYSDHIYVDRELRDKTRLLLRERISSGALELPGAIHHLGASELAALKRADTSDAAKILNLRKILQTTVEQEGRSQPFLLPLGERVAALIELYEDRKISTQAALVEFEQLAQAYLNADAQRQALGMDANTYAIYTALQVAAPTLTPAQAGAINALFVQHPDYNWDIGQLSQLRGGLYRALVPILGPTDLPAVVNPLLKLQRV